MSKPEKSRVKKWRMSRRGFLIGLGATTATVAIGVAAGLPAIRLNFAETVSSGENPLGTIDAPPSSWFEVSSDNTIRFYVPKVEMGQGVHTSLAQIAAEELAVDWTQIEVIQAGTNQGLNDGAGTGNSDSVSSTFTPIRQAAATLREMLRTEAAQQLDITPAVLIAANGAFSVENMPELEITYGDIVNGADLSTWEVPETPPALKPSSQFKFVGKSVQRVDFKSKLTGEAVYGYDMRVPNMLYGTVAHAPTIEGKLRRTREGDAMSKDGVVAVVAERDFAGVVAESRLQAQIGLANMELEWDEGKLWNQDEIDDLVTVGNGTRVVVQKAGEADDILDGNALTASFRTPFAAHAHLEAQAALVDVQPEKVTAWVSTQSAFAVRSDIAEAADVDEEQVEVIPSFLGGGFGRKLNVEVAVEATRLSKAAKRPVHVGWTRTQDMRNGFFRPPTHHVLRGVVGENGHIQAIEHAQASGDVLFSVVPGVLTAVAGADFGAYRGARIHYDGIPNIQTVAHRIKLPVRTGPWRGLGLLANTFAIESFMDDMAHSVDADPLAFRLAHFGDSVLSQRFVRVLETAAERAGWGQPLPEGHALGVACCIDANTVVAQIAEVSVENGRIRVHKVTCALDPGLVINPDGAIAQTQGAIVMGLSSTLFEKITVQNGRIEAQNFDRYPLLTMKETPDIDVMLLESGDEPFGMGEPPIGPIAAAVGNAVFQLTGQRLTSLPMELT